MKFAADIYPKKSIMLINSLLIMLFLGLNYGWSIFVRPLELEYGWTRAETAIIFTVSIITFTIGTLISGQMMRRLRPRTVVQTASFLFLAGFVLSSRISSLPQLMFTYGVLCGLGVGVAYNTVIATILLWFPEKRGTISGLMLMFYGSGTLALGSLTSLMLNSTLGWRTTMAILGILFFVIIFLGSFLIIPPIVRKPAEQSQLDEQFDLAPRKMIRTSSFWLFYIWIILHGGSGMTIFAHAAPGASDLGASVMLAAALLGLLSIGSGIGRFLAGFSHDHNGLRFTMLAISSMYLIAAVLLQMAARWQSTGLLAIAYVLCGLSFGGVTSLVPIFTGTTFGQRYFYMNFGITMTYSIFSVTLGSFVGGLLRDRTGDYAQSYWMIFFYVLAGLFVSLILFKKMAQLKSLAHGPSVPANMNKPDSSKTP